MKSLPAVKHQEWSCKACGHSGAVEVSPVHTFSDVLLLIRQDHAERSQSQCQFDTRKLIVYVPQT